MVEHNEQRRLVLAAVVSLLAHATLAVLVLPVVAVVNFVRSLRGEENEALRLALVIALLVHIIFVPLLVRFALSFEPQSKESGKMMVDLWRTQSEKEKEKTPQEELENYEPEEEVPDGQVVSAPKPKDATRPKDARFLAEHDSKVEKETRPSLRLPGSESTNALPTPSREGQDSQTVNGGMRTVEAPWQATVPSPFEEAEEGNRSGVVRAPPSLKDINLTPSQRSIATALSGTGLDHLEDVIDGDDMALNTIAWRYASFFNRVKAKIQRYWHPDRAYRVHDPYSNVYGFKDRTTVLLVVLRRDGSLKNLYVLSPSGAPFLDDEAHQAVTEAGPFPNVPAGLISKNDGLVKFTFGFIVQIGQEPIIRVRRYP
ncbi:MAG: TonB C-terminal domain-containing protein [Myxococcota bacterium]|jgi:TonB family protein|nr:TonB C-terminal domain-containing protein [Myxococcota bacterium]